MTIHEKYEVLLNFARNNNNSITTKEANNELKKHGEELKRTLIVMQNMGMITRYDSCKYQITGSGHKVVLNKKNKVTKIGYFDHDNPEHKLFFDKI